MFFTQYFQQFLYWLWFVSKRSIIDLYSAAPITLPIIIQMVHNRGETPVLTSQVVVCVVWCARVASIQTRCLTGWHNLSFFFSFVSTLSYHTIRETNSKRTALFNISYAIQSYVVESRRRIGRSDIRAQTRHWRRLDRSEALCRLRLHIHSQVSCLLLIGLRICIPVY